MYNELIVFVSFVVRSFVVLLRYNFMVLFLRNVFSIVFKRGTWDSFHPRIGMIWKLKDTCLGTNDLFMKTFLFYEWLTLDLWE